MDDIIYLDDDDDCVIIPPPTAAASLIASPSPISLDTIASISKLLLCLETLYPSFLLTFFRSKCSRYRVQ